MFEVKSLGRLGPFGKGYVLIDGRSRAYVDGVLVMRYTAGGIPFFLDHVFILSFAIIDSFSIMYN